MAKKQKCFISYSRVDSNLEHVTHLVNFLHKESKGTIEYIFDEQNLAVGHDLTEFMALINSVDAVIMLLSPDYKKKVDDKIQSGVYTEFKIAFERYLNVKEDKKNNIKDRNFANFSIIPIIFSRDFDSSCPKNLKNLLCLDFTDFWVTYNRRFEEFRIIDSLYSRYSTAFKKITSEIHTINSLNKPSVEHNYQELLKILFRNTKDDMVKNSSLGQVDELYVKTSSFYNLQKQDVYFFLGRKGSGKSTLGPLLYKLDFENYKDHIEVNVDELGLEYLLNIILSKALINDLGVVISFENFFKYAWEIFIYLRSFLVIMIEFEHKKLDSNQEKHMPIIIEFMNNFRLSDSSYFFESKNVSQDYTPFFQWAIAKVAKHYEHSIKASSNIEPQFHFDLNAALLKNSVLTYAIPSNVLNAFHSITKYCTKYFLISFDGFDSVFEKFRLNSNTISLDEDIKKHRTKLETGFLEGFLNLIIEIKANKNQNTFFDKINVCVTVPKDRFFEIKDTQRDSYRYIDKFQEIKWTGIELSILLRKRLELLNNFKTEKQATAIQRLEQILNECLPSMPLETQIFVNNKTYSVNTFLNVIRHSFWRPREVLIYFSRLITIIDDFKKRNLKPDNFTISKIISETTFDIIKLEFLMEFKAYCTNLPTIINLFKDSNQIIEYYFLTKTIGNIGFEFINNQEPERNIEKKIDFLYEIGFIGIEVDKKNLSRFKMISQDIFCFNSNNQTYEILKSNNFESCRFIIHPIFCEYLGLETNSQDRLTLDLNWDILSKQDIFTKS